jgi:aminoglycoside phosphotransferase family enzyme/predicted kinase
MIVDDQAETIAFLEDPASYAGQAEAVERIETHISVVFLAGGFAYKLKRAVRYSYLDFSTVEKRAAACAAELALNRRTAPALYLETRAIRREAGGRLGFGGEGALLDTVVVMRRFDQSCLFDRLAQAGALTPGLMRDLADRISAFHRSAEVDRNFGGRSALAGIIDGNEANLAAAVPAVFDKAAVARLISASREALAGIGALVEERRRAGKVRLCHGDLHLRNICFLDGVPTLFDCIEFSRALACIDVLYDLSFLLMDLAHRGLPELANTVFNRYFDLEGEAAGAGALPLYLSLHAAIRAHVGAAALPAKPAERRPEQHDESIAEARAYLDLALKLLRPGKPRLIAIGGLSGTGKSTLAYGLAPCLGAVPGARVLRSDVLRKRLMGMAPESPLPDEAYGEAVTRSVYGRLGEEAHQLLLAGGSVILDAVFLRPGERAAAEALARDLQVDFRGFWLEAPPEILAARIEGRRGDASDATVEILRRQLALPTGPIAWRRVDVGGAPAAALAAVTEMIG